MSRMGDDIIAALEEIGTDLRGEARPGSYAVPVDVLTPERIHAIPSRVASTTRAFEREFAIPARTMEA